MATNQTPASKSATDKAPKVKKEPVALSKRLVDQLKRGALTNKLTPDELDSISALAGALKTFLATA